ncbi:MAG: sulfite exporter TauE/SafE family protein [Arenimonas sp.]|nr:sulfite exporter TauE/SafE family protein [Arenimonas sp.]
MIFEPLYILLGFLVGLIVGLVGVGGGSLMTPMLIFFFGIKPALAIGTDLLFAAITKSVGTIKHHQHTNIDWRITGLLSIGSLPAALLTLWWLNGANIDSDAINQYMRSTLGVMLILTAAAILFTQVLRKQRVIKHQHGYHSEQVSHTRKALTVILGIALGFVVTFSSIGAGAIGMVALYALYSHSPVVRLVGSDIAHAVPLTLIAGIGHASIGSVDFNLLIVLLIGSIPGIWIGSHLSTKTSDRKLRFLLCVILSISGYKLLT